MTNTEFDLIFICKEAIETYGVHAKVRIPNFIELKPTISMIDGPIRKTSEGIAAFILCDYVEKIYNHIKELENRAISAEKKTEKVERYYERAIERLVLTMERQA